MGRTFDFSRFLSSTEQVVLADAARWRWVSPLHSAASIEHPAHERWTRIRGNTYAPPHREIMLTLRGQAVYSVNGCCYQRTPGTVILLDRHDVRDLKGSSQKVAFSCLWLHLYNQEYLTYYINSCDAAGRYTHELPLRVKTGEFARSILEGWDQCMHDPADGLALALLQARVTACLLEVLGTVEVPPRDQHARVVDSLKDYIAGHLAEDLSLRNLSLLAGYSPFFLHRIFQKHAGQTPVQYINAARLARAVELLEAGYKVEAVAEAVGYASLSYFHLFFKKQLGVPPGQWRGLKKKSLVIPHRGKTRKRAR